MPHKGPHISINVESLVSRILRIPVDDFADWPEGVRELTMRLAGELFLVSYNPFINSALVKESVAARFEQSRRALAHHYANSIAEGLTMFWSAYDSDTEYRKALISRLEAVLPKDRIDARPHSRVESATDATDLRMELPLLVVTPATAEEVSAVVQLANEMQFALVPRGGASGLTGGAIPARKRTVILSLTRLNAPLEADEKAMTIRLGAGVITNDAILAAAGHGLLFTVDPASKTASTIGGNIAENSGGPLCFEYGTTIDNVLSYRMVTPTGEIIDIERVNHPRHKIMEDEEAVFEVRDISGGVRKVVTLHGSELRAPGLGKDVTNKALGGLPGMQKEGVDGIVVEATFILHKKPRHIRVIVLEFFGRSMVNAMRVIKDVVNLRNESRQLGDIFKITALEEFGSKYVQAIEYKKKSVTYEGDPISVLILQLEGDDKEALLGAVAKVAEICKPYDGVDAFIAKDAKEAEVFWEDRHRLSAIAKRTSGFKINEDVVIPIDTVPEFAQFIEQVNLECMAKAYRNALQEVGRLTGFPTEEKDLNREFTYCSKVIKGEVSAADQSDEELELRATLFLASLREAHPALARKIAAVEERMITQRIIVATHMHAGDGNSHVNIPVNSNDPVMLHAAEETAMRVMQKAQDIGGEVSGEHGIGITKIAFLSPEKMAAIKEVKRLADPRNIMNPAKLTQKELPVAPFTFSFNRLIQDIRQSGIEDKERLISLLSNVQICTRCGKCKQVCPMHYPGASMLYQPRNKNLVLGALIEAVYYAQINTGKADPFLMGELRGIMEHCTGCGKCTAVCPVKIDSAEVALTSRAILEREKQGGHPLKSKVLAYLAEDVAVRAPKAAKLAATGQRMQNRLLGVIPPSWRNRLENPLFSAPGPQPRFYNLTESLRLDKGSIFTPQGEAKGAVLYFPGCGAALFDRAIACAGILLLLKAGYTVILPQEHLCCGYPLVSAGMHDAYTTLRERTLNALSELCDKAAALGLAPSHLLTACGSCRDGLERALAVESPRPDGEKLMHQDVAQFLLTRLPAAPKSETANLLYHSPCHSEWTGVHKVKAAGIYAAALAELSGAQIRVSPGCCGESGMGAMTSPAIYNKIRGKKAAQLERDFTALHDADRAADEKTPVIVGCPSCKMGIGRTLLALHDKRPVLHTLEYLAQSYTGKDWRKKFRKLLLQTLKNGNGKGAARVVDLSALGAVEVSAADTAEDDE